MKAVEVHEYVYVPGAEMAYCSCGWEHAGEDQGDCDEAWENHCDAVFIEQSEAAAEAWVNGGSQVPS